ncbi:MAG: ATP-binding protein [Gemmataceae bacterium]|nr:ATP-binding protein [Gemmataceae bacterium]
MNQPDSPHYPTRVSIPSDLEEARQLQDQIEQQLMEVGGFSEAEIFAIKLALEEALVNAIKHGNQMDRSKMVHVAFRLETGRFDIQIADEGPGFDPDDVPDCTDPENLERPCGRGLLLMRHYMNRIDYIPPGNIVVMSKWSKNGQA